MSCSPQRLRVGLVGCGKIADSYADEICRVPGVELAAVCDTEILMAERLKIRFGASGVYDDVDRLLAERLDVVHVTTPPQSHLDLARRCFAAGAHVFMEKPVALNTADVAAMLATAEASARKITFNYVYLFEPVALRLRQMAQDGWFGEILHVESFYGYNLLGPFGSAFLQNKNHWIHDLPGRLLHNIIDHLINKIVEFLPPGPIHVHAEGRSRSAVMKAAGSNLFADELRVLLECGGVTAYATFSAHIRPMDHFVRVYGDKRSATANLASQTITTHRTPTVRGSVGRLVPPFQNAREDLREAFGNLRRFRRSEFHLTAGLRYLLRAFYASVRNGAPLPMPYDQVLRVSEVMDEIFSQLRDSR